jgi:hypothetical protein
MQYDGAAFLGRVSFISGPGKNSGKTTFMNRAACLARRAAAEAGLPPPALLTVGYDGETRDYLSGARKPSVPVEAGDLFVSAERFLREGGSSPEILDAAPGRSALGRLCVARAHRAGAVALVGPESNAQLDWLLGRIVDEGLSSCALVDGAVNRITQLAGRPDATLIYSLRIDRAGLESALTKIRRMALLMDLPLADEPGAAEPGVAEPATVGSGAAEPATVGSGDAETSDSEPGAAEQPADARQAVQPDAVEPIRGEPASCGAGDSLVLKGALTADSLSLVPEKVRALVADDFTKIFLDYSALAALLRERSLRVRSRPRFGGFSLITRGLADELVIERLEGLSIMGKPISEYLSFNPYAETVRKGDLR